MNSLQFYEINITMTDKSWVYLWMWIIKNIIFIVIIIIFSTIFKSSSNSAMIGFYFIFYFQNFHRPLGKYVGGLILLVLS